MDLLDTILFNGKIYTVNEDRQVEEAVYISGNKIYQVGSNEYILRLKDDNTNLVDLKGKLVLPGFIETHMHLMMYGMDKMKLQLDGVKSIEEMINKGREFITDNNIPKGQWLIGVGWNQDYFNEKGIIPNKYDLDKISTDHPIAFYRTCYHIVATNSKAMDLSSIDENTNQLPGGQIDKNKDNKPIGVFREAAMGLLKVDQDELSLAERKVIAKKVMADLNSQGITTVHTDDINKGKFQEIIDMYEELNSEGNMKVRAYQQCLLKTQEDLKSFIERGYYTGYGDEKFKIGPLKILADGSLGARTAGLKNVYSDDPTTKGIPIYTEEELYGLCRLAHENKMQIASHAIGDRTIEMYIDVIERLLDGQENNNYRHGIVHCQITTLDLLERIRDLDMRVYAQPIFIDYDWKIVRDRVGENVEKTSYNWKWLVDNKVKLGFGSDCPIEPFNILRGIYHGVTRMDKDQQPKGGWLADQKLSVEEAVYAYTMGGAELSFEEDIKGSIEIGKLADLVVLNEDIFQIQPEKIKDVKVDMTIFNGEIVYIS